MLPATLLLALAAPAALAPRTLWDAWPDARFVTVPAPCLKPAALEKALRDLAGRHPGRLTLEEAGRSFENRPIFLVSLGGGPRKVMLWSQMHGDEPSATPALLDLAHYLLTHAEDAEARAILDGLTLLLVPMVNPDGAERYDRRTAQGIDMNRDARDLTTPEGRLLKALRDRHQPMLGFNLHDQNRRTAVGEPPVLATNSVLAVSGDEAQTMTPGRERSRRACAALVAALAPFTPGATARYDEDWNPRAFGDNLTAWGTPIVLLESGGVPADQSLSELTRLNFVALLRVLADLAKDDLASHDPAPYDRLPRNRDDAYADVALRGGRLLLPGAAAPYRADLAFDVLAGDRRRCGCAPDEPIRSRIVEVGDTRGLATGRKLDATDRLIAPPFVASVNGLAAREWLTADGLSRLGRRGVGLLRWHVAEGDRGAAEAVAHASIGEGRPRIEVVPASAPTAWLRLTGPPATSDAASLPEVLDALAGKGSRTGTAEQDATALLSRLVRDPSAASGPSPVPFRPGRPASFVVVDAAGRLEAVWLDGIEVTASR